MTQTRRLFRSFARTPRLGRFRPHATRLGRFARAPQGAPRGAKPTFGVACCRLSDLPACLACGTCCFSQLESYVKVTGEDYARLAERAEELVSFDGVHAYMRMVDGHCGALQIDPRLSAFVCSAYDVRPQLCRDLERGSPQCWGEREAKSERPLLALRRARTAR